MSINCCQGHYTRPGLAGRALALAWSSDVSWAWSGATGDHHTLHWPSLSLSLFVFSKEGRL